MERPSVGLPVVIAIAALAACRCGGGDSASDADAEAGCTFEWCDQECRAVGRCYGSCAGGRCGCSTTCGDADAPDTDLGDGAEDARDGVIEDAREETDGDIEVRGGGSPGVVCRKLPTGGTGIYPTASGTGTLVAFPLDVRLPSDLLVSTMRVFDWSTSSIRVLDDLEDLPTAGRGARLSYYPSLDRGRLAYGVHGFSAPDRSEVQLRLVDVDSGEKTVLARGSGDTTHSEAIDFVVLRYPWVVWRQVSEETYWYSWTAWYMNIETGVKAEIIPRQLGVVNLDLLGTTAVVSGGVRAVELTTGVVTEVFPGEADQWAGVITPGWIAWLDQVEHPTGTWFSPYGTGVYGQNRATGEVTPLVNSPGMHGPELDGEGDWLAYTDRRDEPDPWREVERSQNIYALHLPTMTEICVENWPGYQGAVTVYQGVGEMRVLFFEERGAPGFYDLWDCNLPTPGGGGAAKATPPSG